MQEKETRFSYVYKTLKKQIIGGQLLPGASLPSSRKLCTQFGVSIYTVGKVLDTLRGEGLIDITPRRAPTVCAIDTASEYRIDPREIVKSRHCLREMYKTITLIMPTLTAFSAYNCDFEQLPSYERVLKMTRRGAKHDGWRTISAFLKEVMQHSGNPLIVDLYEKCELYGEWSFFAEQCKCFDTLYDENGRQFSISVIELLKIKDTLKQFRLLTDINKQLTKSVMDKLSELEEQYPTDDEEALGITFTWNIERDHDYYYIYILRDLQHKIGMGIYPEGEYLPHEAQLAEQYGVSVSTVRKALEILEERGFSMTLNAKGTIALASNDLIARKVLQSSDAHSDVLSYLYGLQLMSLIIRNAAYFTAPLITADDIARIRQNAQSSVIIDDLTQTIADRADCKALQKLLNETMKMTRWGFYFSFFENKSTRMGIINQFGISALRSLETQNYDEFAELMEESYRHALMKVRELVADKYDIEEAQSIRIPRKLSLPFYR